MAVDLAQAKDECRITGTGHDARITAALAAAIGAVEQMTGKKLTRGNVTQSAAAFGNYVRLVWGPEPEDVTVSYQDGDDTAAEMTDARLVGNRLYAPDAGWPSIYTNTPITISYTAGYETTPAELDYAVILSVRDFFDHGAMTPAAMAAVESLCAPYRDVLV